MFVCTLTLHRDSSKKNNLLHVTQHYEEGSVAFPVQQWLRKNSTLLLYTYIVILVNLGYGFTHFSNTQSSEEFCVRVVGNGIICINANGQF